MLFVYIIFIMNLCFFQVKYLSVQVSRKQKLFFHILCSFSVTECIVEKYITTFFFYTIWTGNSKTQKTNKRINSLKVWLISSVRFHVSARERVEDLDRSEHEIESWSRDDDHWVSELCQTVLKITDDYLTFTTRYCSSFQVTTDVIHR